jgi:mRNA interferase RelE/StbE
MWKIIFDEKAIEFLEKTERHISKRIWDKIQLAKENPFRYYKRLKNEVTYSLRVGDYRVIADINNEYIEILLIDHRKRVYY